MKEKNGGGVRLWYSGDVVVVGVVVVVVVGGYGI